MVAMQDTGHPIVRQFRRPFEKIAIFIGFLPGKNNLFHKVYKRIK
jgi:hypothetical protein